MDILVTAATGRVSRELIRVLAARGHRVRALSRSAAPEHFPTGVTVHAADVRDRDALAAAAEGADAVFFVWPFLDAELTRREAAGAIAALGRVRRIVDLSAQAGGDEPESPWALLERAVESGRAEWTHLRPTGFAGNAAVWADQIRQGDVVRWMHPEIRRPLIDQRDIADVAAVALTEDGHAGTAPVLSGPVAVRQDEQVAAIGRALGRRLEWRETDEAELRRLLAPVMSDATAAGMLASWRGFLEHPEPVTAEVERIAGHRPRTFEEWAEANTALFR